MIVTGTVSHQAAEEARRYFFITRHAVPAIKKPEIGTENNRYMNVRNPQRNSLQTIL